LTLILVHICSMAVTQHATATTATDASTTTILWPFVRDYPGEPVPEERFTHSHLSWSSVILYLLKKETMGGSGISWTICKSFAPHSRQITTPVPTTQFFTGRMLFLTPNSVKTLKALKWLQHCAASVLAITEISHLFSGFATSRHRLEHMSGRTTLLSGR